MALGLLLLAVGLAELLAPEKVLDRCIRRRRIRPKRRSWVYTVARLEGLVIVLWVLTAGRGSEQ